MRQTIKGRVIEFKDGQFPTLVSPDKRENGMLMLNVATCAPSKSPKDRFGKTPEEKKRLKQLKRDTMPFQGKVIAKVGC